MEISEFPASVKVFIALILDVLSLIPVIEYIIAPLSFYFLYKVTGMSAVSLIAGFEDILPSPLDILPDNTAIVIYYEFMR